LASSWKTGVLRNAAASASASDALKLIAPESTVDHLALTSMLPVEPASKIIRPMTPVSSK